MVQEMRSRWFDSGGSVFLIVVLMNLPGQS